MGNPFCFASLLLHLWSETGGKPPILSGIAFLLYRTNRGVVCVMLTGTMFVGSDISFHECSSTAAEETYNVIAKWSSTSVKGWNGPGWYLHIEDNGAWSKIGYCPYCGEKLEG